MTEQDARWQSFIERLDQSRRLPAAVGRLAHAASGQRDRSMTCEECRAGLPAYVTDEVGDLPVAARYPEIKHHLEGCVNCEAEYVAILQLAILEDAGQAPAPVHWPVPDLTFLPALQLPDYVRTLAEEIVAAIAPGLTEELHAIADLFFERVSTLGRQFKFGPMTAPALGFGASEVPEALKLLAATYTATVALTTEHSAAEIETQARTGQLSTELLNEAHEAARQTRLSSAQSQRFAEKYAELAARDPRTLHQLASRSD